MNKKADSGAIFLDDDNEYLDSAIRLITESNFEIKDDGYLRDLIWNGMGNAGLIDDYKHENFDTNDEWWSISHKTLDQRKALFQDRVEYLLNMVIKEKEKDEEFNNIIKESDIKRILIKLCPMWPFCRRELE
ncbi:hypothetical protein [Salegentibacter sp. T436]|uniref:hypothetical protein n=1 Tax=Salegentibacter sp. T436 TaxID=1729720 RepID=UPI0012EB50C8|nr:hypothetical protein [Salegentibacter sp. T436]